MRETPQTSFPIAADDPCATVCAVTPYGRTRERERPPANVYSIASARNAVMLASLSYGRAVGRSVSLLREGIWMHYTYIGEYTCRRRLDRVDFVLFFFCNLD